METEKEHVLSSLKELKVKREDLLRYLQSNDKDIKHEAWVTAEKLIRSGKLELEPLLCFQDHGTRYRVWNLIPDLPRVKREIIVSGIHCFLELLQDKDVNVRRLSWYVTLPKLLSYVNLDDVKRLTGYCREVATEEWRELLDETCREMQD